MFRKDTKTKKTQRPKKVKTTTQEIQNMKIESCAIGIAIGAGLATGINYGTTLIKKMSKKKKNCKNSSIDCLM